MQIIQAHLGETLALSCGLCWAIAVCLFKKSGETMPPMSLNLVKNLVAALLFAITMAAFDQPILIDAPREDFLPIIISGLVGMAIADNLFLSSLNRIGAGLWAIIDCLYTPSVIVLAFLFLGERLTASDLLGAALVVAAILIASVNMGQLRRLKGHGLTSAVLKGLLGIVLMAVGGIILKPVLSRQSLLWIVQTRLLAATIGLLLITLLRKNRWQIIKGMWPRANVRHVLLGSLFGPYATVLLWVAGMKYTQVSIAAILNQMSIIFIFVFAGLFLKESLTMRKLAAIVVAFLGVVIVIGF
ncbi:DMT family transporter [bacterium]|nr:DMT family transporter [bacterium]